MSVDWGQARTIAAGVILAGIVVGIVSVLLRKL